MPTQVVITSAIESLVDDFLADGRARGLSHKTVSPKYGAYGYPLKAVLLPWCAEQGINDVAELSDRLLSRLSASLLDHGRKNGKPLSKDSVHSYMGGVNAFLHWAKGQGENVKAKAPTVKLGKRLRDVLTRQEIDAMENAAPSERDKLIVRVLADTGMRVGELCSLRVSDIIATGDRKHFLRIRGKGDQERLAPIMPALHRRLLKFAAHTRGDTLSDRIFLGLRRRPNSGTYEAVTESGVQQMIRFLAQSAGIEKRVYPHLLRHSFVTYCLTRGMPTVQIARIIGHKSLKMINEVYEHLQATDGYDAMRRVLSAYASNDMGQRGS